MLFKDGKKTVEVKDNKKIIYNGEVMSLTAVTRDLLGIDYSVQPSPHWTYDGKLLNDIYNEVYCDEEDY